ncbi:MAG: undecaprenyl/decaprenyl-phosphate alpha-N-acetylglucosaminyl 1-phosphate transferase [Gemmatimonadota bacterium]|nr:undecaprenyl/decaprenyl-phosphate alpha-N-acetylglucosaminyl 1-phosphate transferase [Gemmatimonadota bacterium]
MPTFTLPLFLALAFLASMMLALVSTFGVRGWARIKGYVDLPGGRRIHERPTPNIGGVAVGLTSTLVFLAFAVSALPRELLRPEIGAMLLGGLLILLLGVWDDRVHLTAWAKFSFQWIIASVVFTGGVRIVGFDVGILEATHLSLTVSYLVTVFWIVAATNALNLIDGSDGVAAGAALFASGSLAVVFALHGDPVGALMAVVLMGACVGFLFFNFPPASIFLGDGGSLFLGYTLATLGVITTQKASTLVALVIPLVAFGVPLMDTTIAIVRRFLRQESVFSPDRGHVHHRLRDLGHSPRKVALLIYAACAAFAGLSLLLTDPQAPSVLPVFIIAGVVLVMGVQRLNVPELVELKRVFGRGFQQRSVIAHNVRIQTAADLLSDSQPAPERVGQAFRLAFSESEFHRCELWLPAQWAALLPEEGWSEIDSVDQGTLFVLEFSPDYRDEWGGDAFKISVPIRVRGRSVGRLSVFRGVEGERLFTDLRLLSRVLVPALIREMEALETIAAEHRHAPDVRPVKPPLA